MEGNIKLLNVGDGDAILINLKKNNEDLVIVVDGGRPWDYERTVKKSLKKLLQKLNKKSPDIVVATHYDSDHIGGLIPLIKDYIEDIKEVWVHRSPELQNEEKSLYENEKQFFKSQTKFNFEADLINENLNIKEEAIREKSEFVIESIRELNIFIDLIPENKLKEVYHNYTYEGWPEIKVLGPTKEYYSELFPSDINLKDLIIQETYDYLSEPNSAWRKRGIELIVYKKNPCDFLKDDLSARLTPTNKASIVFAIDNEGKRFLFTGDAGIQSFKSIPDWKNEIKNLHWLKVPHHGSDNNLSKEIIDIMKPEYSDNTGDKHQDNPVLNCLSNNERAKRNTRSTKDCGELNMQV